MYAFKTTLHGLFSNKALFDFKFQMPQTCDFNKMMLCNKCELLVCNISTISNVNVPPTGASQASMQLFYFFYISTPTVVGHFRIEDLAVSV